MNHITFEFVEIFPCRGYLRPHTIHCGFRALLILFPLHGHEQGECALLVSDCMSCTVEAVDRSFGRSPIRLPGECKEQAKKSPTIWTLVSKIGGLKGEKTLDVSDGPSERYKHIDDGQSVRVPVCCPRGSPYACFLVSRGVQVSLCESLAWF